MAVLPPIEESTIASKDVGTCTNRMPLLNVAATKPIMSPMTPPPRAMMTDFVSHGGSLSSDNNQSSMPALVALDLEVSPGGT